MIQLRVRAAFALSILWRASLLAAASALPLAPAQANNVGENAAWQFKSAADKVNAAVVQDMVQKRKSGYYAAPVTNNNYVTNIERQYNCDVAANATGSQGTNSTVANSPSSAGASSHSTGNANQADVGSYGATQVGSSQTNTGVVGAAAAGNTNSYVNGAAWQALNSNQSNSGSQSASVTGSTACAYGAVN